MMITHYALHYKNRILQSFLIIALVLFCYAFARNISTIPDDITPLSSGNVEAMFYIENEETGTITCVGDGLINTTNDVSYNEEVVQNAIVSSPDYSAIIGNNLTVHWNTIRYSGIGYEVSGYIGNKRVSVKDYGAVGDGKTDDTNAILKALKNNKNVYFPRGTYIFNTAYVNLFSSSQIYGEGVIKFSPWSKQWVAGTYTNVFDGTCDISRISDPVYLATHWPSEGLMTEDSRTNVCASTEISLNDTIRKICYHGAVVRVKGSDIPDKFTICLGKGQLYGYKNNKWILLKDELPRFALFDASWKNPSINIPNSCITRFDDHIEITLTKDMWFSNNDEYLLHYFGTNYILSDNEDASEYQYFLASYKAWAKESYYSNCFLFGVSMDVKTLDNSGGYELGIGKTYLLDSTPKTSYFYNVPDSKYDEIIAPWF